MQVKFQRLPSGLWHCVEGKEWADQQVTFEHEAGENPKTGQQRKALHVWLRDLAFLLNAAGLERITILEAMKRKGVELPWTLEAAKEILYKPVLEALTGKLSTEEMNTVEPSHICEVLGRHLAEKYGVTCPPWPTRFQGE